MNNALRSNYVKSKIDYMQQKSKCRFYHNRDESINQIRGGGIKLS